MRAFAEGGLRVADSCCGTVVDVGKLQARQRRVLYAVLAVNAMTFVVMLAASVQSRSTSLLSGGLDNLGDAITYALSIAVVGAGARAKARVALVKGALILAAAVAVGVQIILRLVHPGLPIFETIGIIGALNLLANLACLALLNPYRHGDVNMSSAWECSRNDVAEGFAVLIAAGGVWLFGTGWPDLLIGSALLLIFLRSAVRIFRNGLADLRKCDVPTVAVAPSPQVASPADERRHCSGQGCCEHAKSPHELG
ncbi:MAG: cation transporter [Rhodanobacter sp.]